MARIINSTTGSRRIIKLSTDDIISIIQEYQQLTNKFRHLQDIRDILEDKAIFIPEG